MTGAAILGPTIALAGLVFAIWFTLFVQRTRHMRRNPATEADFASGEAALRYFRPVEMPANNLANLFEMPVLYFALVPLLLMTGLAGAMQVALAWTYVLLRAMHSYMHVGPKKVRPRFIAYLASCVILAAMWIGFAVDLVARG